MSSFVWMKFLESSPERYDLGMRMLTCGRIAAVYERVAELTAAPGKRILDIGCGTGGVSLACAARGATVTGIDIDAGMLQAARRKPVSGAGRVEFLQFGAAEIGDHFTAGSLDAVVCCLALSEMSPEEQIYALALSRTRLVPGGILVIADETEPEGVFARIIFQLLRLPVVAVVYLLTQAATRALHDPAKLLRDAGFSEIAIETAKARSMMIVRSVNKAP